jgi:hypothetical protein
MATSAEQERPMQGEEPMAFDLWVRRALKDRYGGVAREPVPDDLLELLSTAAAPH